MKTSQDQQGQQDYGRGWDERQMTVDFCISSAPMGRKITGGCRMYGKEEGFSSLYWILQHFPEVCWPYGSSARPTGPQTEGTCKKDKISRLRVILELKGYDTNQMVLRCLTVPNKTAKTRQLLSQQWTKKKTIYLELASLTLIRGRARSSLRRWLCSIRRLNFSSDIDCRPPVRVLMIVQRVDIDGWICLEKDLPPSLLGGLGLSLLTCARCWERGWERGWCWALQYTSCSGERGRRGTSAEIVPKNDRMWIITINSHWQSHQIGLSLRVN